MRALVRAQRVEAREELVALGALVFGDGRLLLLVHELVHEQAAAPRERLAARDARVAGLAASRRCLAQ